MRVRVHVEEIGAAGYIAEGEAVVGAEGRAIAVGEGGEGCACGS